MIKPINSLVLTTLVLGLMQLVETIQPGLISGPVNLGIVWLVFVLVLISTVTTAKPAHPPAPERPQPDDQC